MKNLFLAVGLLAATPAYAEGLEGEAHAQINAGIERSDAKSEGLAGFAVGYDFDLSKKVFIGAEVGIDKVLAEDTDATFGAIIRAGAKLTENDKLYGLAGVASSSEETQAVYGAGLEHSFGRSCQSKAKRSLLTKLPQRQPDLRTRGPATRQELPSVAA